MMIRETLQQYCYPSQLGLPTRAWCGILFDGAFATRCIDVVAIQHTDDPHLGGGLLNLDDGRNLLLNNVAGTSLQGIHLAKAHMVVITDSTSQSPHAVRFSISRLNGDERQPLMTEWDQRQGLEQDDIMNLLHNAGWNRDIASSYFFQATRSSFTRNGTPKA